MIKYEENEEFSELICIHLQFLIRLYKDGMIIYKLPVNRYLFLITIVKNIEYIISYGKKKQCLYIVVSGLLL
jgi:hypothetical protein